MFQEVHPGSPALQAGLKPYNDYIIGADSVLHEVFTHFSLYTITLFDFRVYELRVDLVMIKPGVYLLLNH